MLKFNRPEQIEIRQILTNRGSSASVARHGETGIVVNRLPPEASCFECDADSVALNAFIDAVEKAQAIDRNSVRAIAAGQFATTCIVNDVTLALKAACAATNIDV